MDETFNFLSFSTFLLEEYKNRELAFARDCDVVLKLLAMTTRESEKGAMSFFAYIKEPALGLDPGDDRTKNMISQMWLNFHVPKIIFQNIIL